MKSVRTTCPYCGVGCGVVATIDDSGEISVAGDEEHPANYGRLCSKGSALAQTLDLEDRLLEPRIRGEAVGWDKALTEVADSFTCIIDEHGKDAVAFYVSGQLLTEDYYVANKLMKGFIGSGNIDTNSRLCMSSAVAGHKRAFGSDTVPGCYEDFEQADLIILEGSNTAWCHPVLYQRITAAKKSRPQMRVVVIDPRETATCEIADMHIPIKPGTDIRLFNLLLSTLAIKDLLDQDYIDQYTEGFDLALAKAVQDAGSLEATASYCGLDVEQLKQFVDWFCYTDKTVTLFSQGINQSSYGTDKVNAIINCHLATGRIGKEGMGPFSMTGQPNAMGGREVGALANQLAHHMDYAPADIGRLKRFWDSEAVATKPGLKAVDLFQKIESGDIKAVWIMATNPVVSLPNADQVKRALAKCEMVVVSDCMAATDTMAYADIALPALGWGEKDGTVTNSERRISRQRAFLEMPGKAKPDWWIVKEVARRMHYKGFDYKSSYDVYAEVVKLSGYENEGQRDFNISAHDDLTIESYEDLIPFQWPLIEKGVPDSAKRFFSEGQFYTSDKKARFIAVKSGMPAKATDKQYPYAMSTGRIRDQWHTMTRTGKAPRLGLHIVEPFISIHPDDAAREKIKPNSLVSITSRYGNMIARADLTDTQQVRQVFVPMHWNEQFSSKARMGAVVNDYVDPVSGQPEFKHTPVKIESYAVDWEAIIYSRERLDLKNVEYWSLSRRAGYWYYELAGRGDPHATYQSLLEKLREQVNADAQWLDYSDNGISAYRSAALSDGKLQSGLFIERPYALPTREWVESLFEKDELSREERSWLLSGHSPPGTVEQGAIVCSCFGVGESRIKDAITNGVNTVEALGEQLQCGTNCGSCIPELKKYL